MKASKIYTAQEMREAADFFIRNSESVRQKVMSNSVLANIHESTEMLRQAAEMLGRCEEKRKELDEEWFYDGAENLTLPMNECYKIVDYILRGDAGEEEERERR